MHVRDAGRGDPHRARRAAEHVAGEVFNVGRTSENYRKLDLVEMIRRRRRPRRRSRYVHRDEDPRDYKVASRRSARVLGFETEMTVPDGIAEIVAALDDGPLRRPVRRPAIRNIP